MPQRSQANIIHFQLAVSFIIPFNLLDSARSPSKLSAVCLVGVGGNLDVLHVGPVPQSLFPEVRVVSAPGAHDWGGKCCVLKEMTPPPSCRGSESPE